jgi:hypothetical protein
MPENVQHDKRVPHPHDEHLRFGWKIVRYGMNAIRSEDEKRRQVLDWIERMKPRFPGSPFLAAWESIVSGRDLASARLIESTVDFFNLPSDSRGWWRQLVQSQPFTTIIPGKTAHERRAVLSRSS